MPKEEYEKETLAEKNNVSVYKTTTRPKTTKHRDKSDLGPDFIAPDGGWGWVVCIASGLSNFSIFPALQQYGLLYRERMERVGFDAKQVTTIVNIVMSLSSLVGIVNGAMFRRFTFRQVAIVGGSLCFLGIFLSAFCTNFIQYVIALSCIYGIGLGLSMAATSLAVNTYFKLKRRKATGFAWTITGLGPIIFPYITTSLLGYCGSQGRILIFSAIALNAVLCGCTLQPVLWHTGKKTHKNGGAINEKEASAGNAPLNNESNTNIGVNNPYNHNDDDDNAIECDYCKYQKLGKRSIFTSQYLFNDDDPEKPGYEITEPGPPMLARANDGWFGSKQSLGSERGGIDGGGSHGRRRRRTQESLTQDEQQQYSALDKPNYFNRERDDMERYASKLSLNLKVGCTCAELRALMQQTGMDSAELKKSDQKNQLAAILMAEEEAKKSKMTFKQKLIKFFDLDLLKDFTFVNLAMGMTIMMFGEMNFSVLTPFILHSYGYNDHQISIAMSLLGGMDITVRFLAPFALEKVKLGNRVLFAFGILSITLGRFIITLTSSYELILVVFLLIGFGKGFRTIFSPLIIPSYVPLNRLPAASGLQLICNTIFSLIFGPILGIITDATSYTVTIHFINTLTTCALLLWAGESIVRHILKKKSSGSPVQAS